MNATTRQEPLTELPLTTSDVLRHIPIPEIPREHWGAFAGSYQILEHVGAGNTGRVYKAIAGHLSRGSEIRFVAVKTLSALVDPLAEAHTGSEIAHTNVASVIDCGKCSGIPYVVSEWVEPEEGYKAPRTFDLWAQGRPAREIVTKARAILEALSVLHSRFIAHRDVKASNILVDRQGRPRLVDFGMGGPSRSATQDVRLFLRMLRRLIPEPPETLDRIMGGDARYSNAELLSEDLRRWLDNEPIPWMKPGPLRRVVLLARRKPYTFPGAIAAVFILVMAGILIVRAHYVSRVYAAKLAHEQELREAADQAYTNMANTAMAFIQRSRQHKWDQEYLPIMAALDAIAGHSAFTGTPERDFVRGKASDSPADLLSMWEKRKIATRKQLSHGVDGVYELSLQTALARWEIEEGNLIEARAILEDNLEGWRNALIDQSDPQIVIVEEMIAEVDQLAREASVTRY